MKKVKNIKSLIAKLDYAFTSDELLIESLTHRSAGAKNYERLEFLGDSIVNFVIADKLFSMYPQYPEGDLSRLRASLVNKDGLAMIARDLSLGEYLILGSCELKSGGYRRASILADALEALIAAVLLEDRKSTRLNSSHRCISYAVFCLKKTKNKNKTRTSGNTAHEKVNRPYWSQRGCSRLRNTDVQARL